MRSLFILMTLLVAAACTGGADEPATRSADIVRSPGKPQHPIQVRAVVDGPLRAGSETGATLVVTSSRPVQSVEVTLQPELATVISQNRFERRLVEPFATEASRGQSVDFNFRLRPASDAPQPVRVLVRVTGPDGSVLTRDVTLALSDKMKSTVEKKPRHVTVEDLPEPAGDVVVPAQQEVTRGN
ncbi:MAG TPA: hypothetical protein VF254_03180 [Gammaproteobacteria bacterium]